MASYISIASGAWDTEGQVVWDIPGHPVTGDDVSIAAGHAVTLESATACTSISIASTGSLDTTASNYSLTTTGTVAVSGTLYVNGSTISFASGGTGLDGLQVNGGLVDGSATGRPSGDWTIGGKIRTAYSTACTMNLTTGTLYMDGVGAGGIIISTEVETTWNHNNGTVRFTYAGSQLLYDEDATARTMFYTVWSSGSSGTLGFYTGKGFALTVTNLTISATSAFNTNATDNNATIVTGSLTVSGTCTFNSSTITLANAQINNGGTLANGSANTYISGNLVVGGGTSGTLSVLDSATLHIDGTTTINSGATMGTASKQYVLNMDGNLLASAGTLIAPAHDTWFTFSGSIWNTPTVFTHSNGTVNFDGTTSFGNDSLQFYNVRVVGTLGTLGFTLTAAMSCRVDGVLTPGSSNLNCGSGVTTGDYGFMLAGGAGTLNAGIGTHTFGSLNVNAGGSYTATSGTTYINGSMNNFAFTVVGVGATFAHNNGTFVFNGAMDQRMADPNNVAKTFYNLQFTSSTNCRFHNNYGFDISCTSLIVNASTFTPTEVGTGNSWAVTVGAGGFSMINSGTFTPNTSTVTINGSLTITSGTFGGNSAYVLNLNGTLAFSNGTFSAPNNDIGFSMNGSLWIHNGGIFTPNGGQVNFTRAGTTSLSSNEVQFANVKVFAGTTLAVDGYTLTTSGNFDCFGNVTVTTATITIGGTLDVGGASSTFGGNSNWNFTVNSSFALTNAGATFSAPNGSGLCYVNGNNWVHIAGTFTPNGGTVIFNRGSGTTTLNQSETGFANIQVNPGTTLAVADKTITLSGNCVLTNGNLSVGSGGTINITGAVSITNGTFGSSVNYNATIGGQLIINSGSGTFRASTGTTTINGSVTNNGTFYHDGGTLALDGTSADSTIFGITSINSANNVTVTKGVSYSLILNSYTTFNGTLTINSGTVKSQAGQGRQLTVGGLITIKNTGTLGAVTPDSLGGGTYNAITIESGGLYIASTETITNGIINGGTVNGNNRTITLGASGNFDCTGGSITNKLVIAKATGYTLTAPTINGTGLETINATISGNITITAGFLHIKNYGTTTNDFRTWGTESWNTCSVYPFVSGPIGSGISFRTMAPTSGTTLFYFNVDNVGVNSITIDVGTEVKVLDTIDVYTKKFFKYGTWNRTPGYMGFIHTGGGLMPYDTDPIEAWQIIDSTIEIDAGQVLDA
jgi:hypothetical protein